MKPISFPFWLTLLLGAVACTAVKEPSPVQAEQMEANLPAVATITELVNGDLACYVDLIDNQGNQYQGLYATFEICEETALIGQTVKLTYQPASFNDCDSNEPCGKSKTELAIVQIEPWEN
ncbi:hypothetical protein [Synechocystis salina]|uniref:Uncharacterized protein n=1 Tax=Synechocystis salina LEGE 00031 TaxID=1828736 RepID=A0ABR9VUL9_9SYNC|nr:hypothetical protein [Synechocystis salina]MBE9241759.1 hypothetical protein [Synechocystis salina LEGE 00041]MBE9255044.1 hypothetical protein [Synechocystis salina LEGE 00031]